MFGLQLIVQNIRVFLTRSTINATNKFIYKPKVNEIGENIESTAHTIIAYSIVGLEETLYLGNQTRNYKKLKRLMKKDPDRVFQGSRKTLEWQ